MASLNPVLAARERAERLRVESQALRFANRRTVVAAREQVERSLVTYAAARERHRTVPSPWSPLMWRLPDRELGHALELV